MTHALRTRNIALAAAVGSLAFGALALAPCAVSYADGGGWRSQGGQVAVAGSSLEASTLEVGRSYFVSGTRDARLVGEGGLAFRAMPGTRFRVEAPRDGRSVVRVDDGTVTDLTGGLGGLDVAARTVEVRTDAAKAMVRVTDAGVYVEHMTGSTGTVSAGPRGAAKSLAAGTFRAYAVLSGEPTNMVTSKPDARIAAAPAPSPAVPATFAVSNSPQPGAPGPDWVLAEPARTEWRRVPCAPGTARPGEEDCWELVQVPARYERCAVPAPVAVVAPAPCPPPPCAPPPSCPDCGEYVIHSGVPVPVRADDTGRVPLGTALYARGECENCVGTECNRVPYVHYVEGLVCDVATYKVGCCLITVRPASRVRVHRLPDGSLQMWAPNIGKDLALIEINENQAGYIGEDGFLVVSSDCQIEYFRGLVHLYKRRNDRRTYDLKKHQCVEISVDGTIRRICGPDEPVKLDTQR